MKIYVISYGGYDSSDDIDIYQDEQTFLDAYAKFNKQDRDNIRYIIKGTEWKPVVKTTEVIKEWKLERET